MKKWLAVLLALLTLSAALTGCADGLHRGTAQSAQETAAPDSPDMFVKGYARANGVICADSGMTTVLANAENALVYVLAWTRTAPADDAEDEETSEDEETAEAEAYAETAPAGPVATIRFASAEDFVYTGCIASDGLVMLSDAAAEAAMEGALSRVRDGSVVLVSTGIVMFWDMTGEDPGTFRIVTQPESQVASPDGVALFTVEAAPRDVTYQWQSLNEDGEWVDSALVGNMTPELAVPGKEKNNGSRYRCVVTAADGAQLISDDAMLILLPADMFATESASSEQAPAAGPEEAPADVPEQPAAAAEALAILAQPEDASVDAEEKVRFTVRVNRADVTYQWQVLVIGTTDWVNTGMNGCETEELYFTAKYKYTGRRFRCVITDGDGNTVISRDAVLTVGE